MLYINTQTGEYPVAFSVLKSKFPTTGFSKPPKEHQGYVLVVDGPIPTCTQDQYIEEGQPIEADGVYTRNWVVKDYTPEQVAQRKANADAIAARSVRVKRDNLLAASDWTQVSDAPVDQAAWQTYRQALRDITTQSGFPYEIIWPVKPE